MTLVTAKTQKLLYTCVCTRAREDSRTHHFTFINTIFSRPFLLLLNFQHLNLLFQLFPLPSPPYFDFPQNDESFFKNDKSLFIKRRVTFHKTTGRFSQNNGSFFLQNKTHAALLQNLRTFVAWTNQFIVSHNFSEKGTFTLSEQTLSLYLHYIFTS